VRTDGRDELGYRNQNGIPRPSGQGGNHKREHFAYRARQPLRVMRESRVASGDRCNRRFQAFSGHVDRKHRIDRCFD
jgi:hypothetical protein